MTAAAWFASALLLAPTPGAQISWPTRSGFDINRYTDGCEFEGWWPVAGRSDVRLSFNLLEGRTLLIVSSEDWTNRPDEEFELAIGLDDTAFSAPAVGLPRAAYRKGFSVLVGDDFLTRFGSASQLVIMRGETVVAHLNLRNTALAVRDLRACNASVQRAIAVQAAQEARVDYIAEDPFAEPGTPLPSSPPVRPPVITNPVWASAPRPTHPDRARERGITGSADLSCTVNPNGSVSGCSVVSETPAGAGFGRAALAAARSARLSPRSVDGVASGGTVRFTQRFDLPD